MFSFIAHVPPFSAKKFFWENLLDSFCVILLTSKQSNNDENNLLGGGNKSWRAGNHVEEVLNVVSHFILYSCQ